MPRGRAVPRAASGSGGTARAGSLRLPAELERVFGAEAAAQRYFRKPAKALTRREAALLATALPNPLVRNPARPTRRHQALAGRLLARMEVAAPFSECLKG